MQKQVMLSVEANNWYRRNVEIIDNKASKDVFLYEKYIEKLKNGKVLEIGCADGHNLNYLFSKYSSNVYYGIDPSSEAIEKGIKKYCDAKLFLNEGTSDDLPYENESIDVVIFGFCLYLVDPILLTKTIWQADRILKNKGILVITDFDESIPRIRKYRHYEGIYSRKYNYAKIFEALPFYSIISKESYSSSNGYQFNEDISERICTVILYKDLDNSYILEKD